MVFHPSTQWGTKWQQTACCRCHPLQRSSPGTSTPTQQTYPTSLTSILSPGSGGWETLSLNLCSLHCRHVDLGNKSERKSFNKDGQVEVASSSPRSRKMMKFVAVSLNFTIRMKHVRIADNVLSLKCTAEVWELYWRTSEVSVTVSPSPSTWFSAHAPTFSSSTSSLLTSFSNLPSSVTLVLVLLSFEQF